MKTLPSPKRPTLDAALLLLWLVLSLVGFLVLVSLSIAFGFNLVNELALALSLLLGTVFTLLKRTLHVGFIWFFLFMVSPLILSGIFSEQFAESLLYVAVIILGLFTFIGLGGSASAFIFGYLLGRRQL